MIKTINFDQTEMIKNILALHTNGVIDLDPTYSKGNFYTSSGIPKPRLKYDLNPIDSTIKKACATALPLADNSIETTIFDPPFLATKGPSLKSQKGNKINRRFGVFETEQSLHNFYSSALKEIHRITKRNGVLIFKCQDKVSSGKQYFSHCFIYAEARRLGWYAKDLFVLMAKNRLIADWQRANQIHARKYHCYFWVFEKRSRSLCI